MELKRELRSTFLLACLFLSFSGCIAKGTEVLSPPNPNESPGPQKIDTQLYTVDIDLVEGWSFVEYGPDVAPGPEVRFQDPDPNTIVVAQFLKGDSGFTVFFSFLDQGQGLVDYVRERRPVGDLILFDDQGDSDNVSTDQAVGVIFNQKEPGLRGGFEFDLYLAVDNQVLWMRSEMVGTVDEINQTLDEWVSMVGSIEFIPKK